MPRSAPIVKAKPMPPEATRLVWGRDQFTAGPGLDQPCPEVIDVTGRMRALVFGPMVVVPAGRWRLTVRVALSEDASRHGYILQFIHGEQLAELRFKPCGAGTYTLEVDNGFALDAMAALRFWLADPAFHGELLFLGAEVERLADEPSASEGKAELAEPSSKA